MRAFSSLFLAVGVTLGGRGPSTLPVAAESGPGVEPQGRSVLLRDTVVAARPGDVFESETLRGTLLVRPGGDEIRMSADADPDDAPRLIRDGRTVRLQTTRGSRDHDVLLELPSWMPVAVRSREMDVSVTELEAEVRIEVLRGDVRVEGAAGPVDVRTLDGEVEVRRTEGVMSVFSADGDVRVVGHRGRLQVESNDGDLTLRDVEGEKLTVSALDGDIEFDGAVTGPGGSLELSTHDGDVRVGLPASIQADVEVSTFNGGFSSEFKVQTRGFRAGEPLRFTIGDGGARITLRSFDGDVSMHSR